MIKFFRALKNLKFSIDGQCPATQRGRPFWYHPKSWNVKDKENFVLRFGELGKKLSEKEANVNFKVID